MPASSCASRSALHDALRDRRRSAACALGTVQSRVRLPLALVLSALLASASTAFALNPAKQIAQYVHVVWDSDRGLPQNSVTAIVQTPDGYIWVGTQEGLVRFDGVRFTIFDRRQGAIPHNYVTALFAARDGSLWIGTNDGGVTRYDGGQFTATSWSQQRSITSFAEQGDGTLWIGTQEGGVVGCRKDVCRALTTADGLPSNRIQALLRDGADRIWIATLRGVALATRSDDRLRHRRDAAGCCRASIGRDSHDVVWIAHRAWPVPNRARKHRRRPAGQLRGGRRCARDSGGPGWQRLDGRGRRRTAASRVGRSMQHPARQRGPRRGRAAVIARRRRRRRVGGHQWRRPGPLFRRHHHGLHNRAGAVEQHRAGRPRGSTRRPVDRNTQRAQPAPRRRHHDVCGTAAGLDAAWVRFRKRGRQPLDRL